MACDRKGGPMRVNPVFRATLDDLLSRAGVFSALPDAPVVPDRPPPCWRAWIRHHVGRLVGAGRVGDR